MLRSAPTSAPPVAVFANPTRRSSAYGIPCAPNTSPSSSATALGVRCTTAISSSLIPPSSSALTSPADKLQLRALASALQQPHRPGRVNALSTRLEQRTLQMVQRRPRVERVVLGAWL